MLFRQGDQVVPAVTGDHRGDIAHIFEGSHRIFHGFLPHEGAGEKVFQLLDFELFLCCSGFKCEGLIGGESCANLFQRCFHILVRIVLEEDVRHIAERAVLAGEIFKIIAVISHAGGELFAVHFLHLQLFEDFRELCGVIFGRGCDSGGKSQGE